MPYALRYHPDVARLDVPRVGHAARSRVERAIEDRLVHAPDQYGKPLRGTMKGLWSLRIGDYRAIYRIDGEEVQILRVGHRREAYDDALVVKRKR